MIKVLHTADWHIGNFSGPEQDGENARFKDICKCLDALAKSSEKEKPDIALISGDIFHTAKVWSDRGLRENQTAASYINKLSYDCPVIVMRGTPNHDSTEQFKSLKQAFRHDCDVHIVTEPKVIELTLGEQNVCIACLPGFDRGYFRARHPGLSREEENEVFTKFLAETVTGLKAQCNPEYPTILMTHYTVPGCNMESGQTAFFQQVEPVIYPDTLNAAGFDLVCLGHIHRPQKLPLCDNAYYSGAVSQLNFNDEGQERGFYYHKIVPGDKKAVESTFVGLPTREFCTLQFGCDDIREIIENGPDIIMRLPILDSEDHVNGKIVRVLYECTDELNKAFNHKTLSDYLYSIGAFYVQEITPCKISISVDKKAMDSDSSPESNLKNFLEEKEMSAEQIAAIIELAMPIIDEAIGKKSKGEHKGVFVPREIEVKNYRNYREERFSYDSISFCTISGSNGVGKSSLFMDAMADALFEEPREGDLTGWICNDSDARSGSIKFTFSLGDSTYRVTRTRQKSGKATLNIAEKVDGEWVDRSKEKMRDTQTEIENIIGIDSLTLKACALIMQDQYGLFLQAGKEERMAILGNILGLGIYSDMEDMAAAKATDVNREIRTLNDKLEQLNEDMPDMADIDSKLTEYENQHKENAEHSKRCEDELITLKSELKDKESAAEKGDRLNSEATELAARISDKKDAAEKAIAVVKEAHATLIREKEIEEAYAKIEELTRQQKELIEQKAVHESYKSKLFELEENLYNIVLRLGKINERKSELIVERRAYVVTPEHEQELDERHAEYEAIRSKIARYEDSESEYLDKKRAVDMANVQVEVTKAHYTKIIDSIRYEIKECEGKVKLLSESGCPISENASCKFLKDAMEAKAKLPEHLARLETAEKEFESELKADKAKRDEAAQALKAVSYDQNALITLRQELKALESSEAEYKAIAAKKSEADAIAERIKDLDAQLAELETEKSGIEDKIKETEDMCAKSEEAVREHERVTGEIASLEEYRLLHDSLPVLRERHKSSLDRHEELLKEIAEDEKRYREKLSEADAEMKKASGAKLIKDDISQLQDTKSIYDAKVKEATYNIAILGNIKASAAEKQGKIDSITSDIVALGKTAAGYETLKKAFSQDGIPHNIIRSIIPIFEATATNIIGQMSAGKMSVEIVTEKVLKHNNKKEVTTLDVIVNDSDTGELPYMSRSGGERVKAALAVILALSEIKSTKAGIQIGFLAIDEPPFLDESGTQAYVDALETIQKRYPDTKIMAISHDESFKARFPQNITIYKDENGSHIGK